MKRITVLLLLLLLLVACAGGDEMVEEATAVSHPPTHPPPTASPEPEPMEVSDDLLLTAVSAPPFGQVKVDDIGPDFATLAEGWTKVDPGGDTRCAHDSPFSYWVRPGTVDKLLIFFEGGGGCWDAQTCAHGSNFYDPDVGSDEDPTRRGGILDFSNPENPFQEYHAVYIPSCNGDIYWGNSVQNYPKEDGSSLRIFHRGFVNASAALAWAYEQLPEPDSVFVTGCSAGSVGSRVHTPYIIQHYADAEVTQLGDSLAFVFGRPVRLDDYNSGETFPDWIPELADLVREDGFLMAEYDSIVANHYPDYTFSQYNTAVDNVQVRFYTAVSDLGPEGFEADLATHLSSIHAEAPNFRSYTADGSVHCILPGNQFYTRVTDGTRLVDWVSALANGEDVSNVQCADCQVEFADTAAGD